MSPFRNVRCLHRLLRGGAETILISGFVALVAVHLFRVFWPQCNWREKRHIQSKPQHSIRFRQLASSQIQGRITTMWWERQVNRQLREIEETQRQMVNALNYIVQQQETQMAAIDNLRAGFTDVKAAVTEGMAEITDLLGKLTSANNDPAIQAIADEMVTVAAGVREAVAASNTQFPDTTPPPVDPPPTPSGA